MLAAAALVAFLLLLLVSPPLALVYLGALLVVALVDVAQGSRS